MKIIGFDFETTGLSPYRGDQAKLMGYTSYDGTKNHVWLDQVKWTWIKEFFSEPDTIYCAHNAKFELGFLKKLGIEVKGPVWDTEVMARIENNNQRRYDLQSCALRIKSSKHPPMLAWLKQRGNKGQHLKAPHDILLPYVEQDAWLSWELCHRQIELFRHWDVSSPVPIKNVVRLEMDVLPHLFEMEARGLLLDVNYCQRAREYEKSKIESAKSEFRSRAGVEFVASSKCLKPIFDSHGIRYGATELGNASFSEDSIRGDRSHPIVAAILDIRTREKRLSSYWESFLTLEHNGLIHPSINQNRAQTGRMSISEPSCQNWPTDEDGDMDDEDFPVRRAFLARPDCFIASLDYSGMELRLGADDSGDTGLIDRLKTGADLHQEVADMAGVSRPLAKNGRFAKQYGAGIKTVAETLGVAHETAAKISRALEDQAPIMAEFSENLSRYVKQNKWGYDWLGRRFHFDRGFEYKAFNYRIQGGCAEILKIAIIAIGKLLKEKAHAETFMLIPIHDEIVLNMHNSDRYLLPEIKRLMIEAHQSQKHLPMDVSVHTGQNFYDMEKVA